MRISARAVVIKDNRLLVMDRDKFGFKYLSLPGGAVEIGEQPEQAAIREVLEESTVVIDNPKLVIDEDAGAVFGRQYIYICQFVSGQPVLGPDSVESRINAGGKNLYRPKWLDVDQLAGSNLLPKELKDLLVVLIRDGFPDQPIRLKIPTGSTI